jgi:hypothetical protein
LQTAGRQSLLPAIAPRNSPRKESHIALTTDVLAEIMVWVPSPIPVHVVFLFISGALSGPSPFL